MPSSACRPAWTSRRGSRPRPARPTSCGVSFLAAATSPRLVALGANTDPYQPAERDRGITRGLLGVLRDFSHPVAVTTKGVMVERDADILGEMGPELARVGLSVTTLDADLARKLEPRVPSPARRLKAVERLARAGVQVRVMVSPVIPGLTDHELETVLAAARDAGAVAASMIPLRLPMEVAPLFEEWLRAHVPGQARKVLNRIRQFHDGKLYDGGFGRRMRGTGVHADLLRQRFRRACRRRGTGDAPARAPYRPVRGPREAVRPAVAVLSVVRRRGLRPAVPADRGPLGG